MARWTRTRLRNDVAGAHFLLPSLGQFILSHPFGLPCFYAPDLWRTSRCLLHTAPKTMEDVLLVLKMRWRLMTFSPLATGRSWHGVVSSVARCDTFGVPAGVG